MVEGAARRDPYAILNVERHATNEDIQRSYRQLSRAFHPDKQPGASREEAQRTFVEFGDAYDILTNSVLRRAYDEFGDVGVALVRRWMYTRGKKSGGGDGDDDDVSEFETLVKLFEAGDARGFRNRIEETLVEAQYLNVQRKLQTTSDIEIKCKEYTSSGSYLGLPEVERVQFAFSSTAVPPALAHQPDPTSATAEHAGSKLSLTIGGRSTVSPTGASAGGQLSVGYKPTKRTDVHFDFDTNEKISLSTTRVMSSRTVFTAGISTVPQQPNLIAYSMSTFRSIFQDKLRATVSTGLGSDLKFHYFLISANANLGDMMAPFGVAAENKLRKELSTTNVTVKLSAGVDRAPIKITADAQNRVAPKVTVSLGGPYGTSTSVTWRTALSKFCRFSFTIRRPAVRDGGTDSVFIFSLSRGDVNFSLPFHLTSRDKQWPSYPFSGLCVAFLTVPIVDAVHEWLSALLESSIGLGQSGDSAFHNVRQSKSVNQEQLALMTKVAEKSWAKERDNNGLVVYQASYGVEGSGEPVDVAMQLQFWVTASSLRLPPSPKSELLGFHSSSNQLDSDLSDGRRLDFFLWLWRYTQRLFHQGRDLVSRYVGNKNEAEGASQSSPSLRVRYSYRGRLYEVRVNDSDELMLPHPKATDMGDTKLLQ